MTTDGDHGPILVIEDDRDIRESLVEFLEAEGFHAVQAANGREGLALLGTQPCLILLDLYMPVLDGAGFLAALDRCGSRCGVPIAVITAAPPEGSLALRIKPRVDAFLRKPVDLDAVLRYVRTQCQ